MRKTILTAAAFALTLALGGCDSFDPLDKFQEWDVLSSKKPILGDRRAVFPEGTPGVPKGVPPEMVKGYEPPAEPPPQVAEEKTKPKPKKTAAKPKPKKAPAQVQQTPPPAQPASPPQATTTQPAPSATAAWPAIPGSQPTWPSQAPPAQTR